MMDGGQSHWSEPITSLDHFYDSETRIHRFFEDFPRPEGKLHAVLGGDKMGKSSLLNVLPDWLQQRVQHGQLLVPVLIHYRDDPRVLDSPQAFLLRVVKELREGLRSLGLCTISEHNFEPFFGRPSAADGFRDALIFLLDQARQVSLAGGKALGEIRLLGLVDDAETVVDRPWSDNLFSELRKLFQSEYMVRRQLDLVMAGDQKLARYFETGAVWGHGERLFLNPLTPEAVSAWLRDVSGGRSPLALTRAVVVQGGGHPFLTSFLIGGILNRVRRGEDWDRLSPDTADELADTFVQSQYGMLASWLQSLRQGRVADAIWLICSLLAEAGDRGRAWSSIGEELGKLGLGGDLGPAIEQLQWHGVARPVLDAPGHFSAGKVFLQYFRQSQPQTPSELATRTGALSLPRTGRLGLRSPAPDYDDLTLSLSAAREGYQVSVAWRGVKAAGEFCNPFSADEQQEMWQVLTRPADGLQGLEEIGERLFHAVFYGEMLACLREAWNGAQREGLGLRLKFILQPQELHSLPWEFIFDRNVLQFPVLSKSTPLVRYVEQPIPPRRFEAADKLRLMIVAASPSDGPALNIEHEVNVIQSALDRACEEGWLEYTIVQGRETRVENLFRLLGQENYHVFHFLGHGTENGTLGGGALLLERADGLGQPLAARRLADLLRDERDLRLVLLNACKTGVASQAAPFTSVAGALVQSGVPAVVATQYAISDAAAANFAYEFYRALVESLPVEAAVAEARRYLSLLEASHEWGVPVLYLRAENGDVFRSAYR